MKDAFLILFVSALLVALFFMEAITRFGRYLSHLVNQ